MRDQAVSQVAQVTGDQGVLYHLSSAAKLPNQCILVGVFILLGNDDPRRVPDIRQFDAPIGGPA